MPSMEPKKHFNPVWRPLANSTVDLAFEFEGVEMWEELPARDLGDGRFTICCIPFFGRNVALGDVVSVEPYAGRMRVVANVVRPSEFYCYRVSFRGPPDEMAELVLHELNHVRGCALECYSPTLSGIAAPSEAVAKSVVEWLEGQERDGTLEWESANT